MSKAVARWLGAAGLAVLVATLIWTLARLAPSVPSALAWPYDLDYGEGIVWQQLDEIVAGRGYAPLQTLPAIVFHYPPIYHWTAAGLRAATGLDPLTAGRLVSLLSALVAAFCIGGLVRSLQPGTRGWPIAVGSFVAGATFLTGPTVSSWALLMRVDLLATALTMAGLVASARVLHPHSGRRATWVAAALFTLAVYTKQTALPAPALTLVTLWLVDRRAAWQFGLASAILGGGALLWLSIASDGAFLSHVVTGNINRVDLGRWEMIVRVLLSQTIGLAVAGVVAGGLFPAERRNWRARVATDPGAALRFLLLGYATVRVLTLPLALKSGANENYMIDLFSVAAIFVGIGVTRISEAVRGDAPWPRAALTLLVLIGLPVQAARTEPPHQVTDDAAFAREAAYLTSIIRAAPGPVLTDYMVMTKRAGRDIVIEPAIVAELAHAGRYDEAGLVRLIRQRRFALVMNQGDGSIYHERYNPAVRAAIAAAYPRIYSREGAVLRLPPATSGQGASPRN